MGTILQDIRYGWRMLRKSPVFTAIAVLTLGMGIGATTIVLSILDALYLRAPAVPGGEQLVIAEPAHRGISPAEYFFHRDRTTAFSALAVEWPTEHAYLGSTENPRMLLGSFVSANFFDVLKLRPQLGRFFVPNEDIPNAQIASVVLSDHLWRSDFAADPNVVGKTFKLNSRMATVVGVAPAGFHGLSAGIDNDLWLPTSAASLAEPSCVKSEQTCQVFSNMVGRIKAGRGLSAAEAEINAGNRKWEEIYPDLKKGDMAVYWARGIHPAWRNETAPLPRLLLSAVGGLLLIACANIAGLLLAKGEARKEEIVIRLALGAERIRIIRQLLIESALLAGMGCALGLFLLQVSHGWIARFPFHGTESFASYYEVGLNRPVLFATLGVSALVVFVFGLVPALRTSRPTSRLALKDSGSGTRHSTGLSKMLVTAQVTMACALAFAALLVGRSLAHVLSGPGFDASHIAVVRVTPSRIGYSSAISSRVQKEALRRLEAEPGVQAVTLGSRIPWWESFHAWIALPGQEQEERQRPRASYNDVAPNYFATLGIPFISGRDFSESDGPNSPRVIIVNQSLATRMWPGHSVVGETLVAEGTEYTVIGVVRDAQYSPVVERSHLFFYVPYWQTRNGGDARFLVRTTADPDAMLRKIKLVINGVDQEVPVGEDSSMVSGISGEFGTLRITSFVMFFAAAIAVFLSAMGVYGILAFAVNQRTREIGIRMALGATTRGVLRLFLRQGLQLAAIGLVIGLLAALGGARLLTSLLYGVRPADPGMLLLVMVLLAVISILASLIPARRATRVDPMVALRYE
jgi:putative ABC transport system permease protein